MMCSNCENYNPIDNNFCFKCGSVLKTINYTKKFEVILRILNCGLFVPIYIFFYSLLIEFADFISMGSVNSNSFIIEDFGIVSLITFVDVILLIFLNIFFGIYMNKMNREHKSISRYKKVNKLIYIFLAILLGKYGVHRFVIKDIKGGFIYLFFEFILYLIILLICWLFPVVLFVVGLPFLIKDALILSDVVIAISKIKDNDNMILL